MIQTIKQKKDTQMAQLYQIGTHKTVVFTEGTWTKVVYHSTPVVKFNYGSII